MPPFKSLAPPLMLAVAAVLFVLSVHQSSDSSTRLMHDPRLPDVLHNLDITMRDTQRALMRANDLVEHAWHRLGVPPLQNGTNRRLWAYPPNESPSQSASVDPAVRPTGVDVSNTDHKESKANPNPTTTGEPPRAAAASVQGAPAPPSNVQTPQETQPSPPSHQQPPITAPAPQEANPAPKPPPLILGSGAGQQRLRAFMNEFSKNVSGEFSELWQHCVRHPAVQRPCTEASTNEVPWGYPSVLAANEPLQNFFDLHATPLHSNIHRAFLAAHGLTTEPALYPNNSRCAVVGSSPRLLQKEYGELIDSYDVVFRINLAPTGKFEKFVGKKRSVEIATPALIFDPWLRWAMSHRFRHITPVAGTDAYGGVAIIPGITTGDVSAYFRRNYYNLPKEYRILMMGASVRLVGEKLYCQMSDKGRYWPHQNNANAKNGIAPSSGFLATVFALSTCSEVATFGFGHSGDSDDWVVRPYGGQHYYSYPTLADYGDFGGHWYALERYLFAVFARNGLIRHH
eukprot:TRINITY_DN3438_c0_g1_i1.p1 TRINITY_DN3438_c0_g1~~TRINITY_DN3438_c0_g1_i1.p1  ORF type:complete len:522 (-),score=69.31 TRINITY_DN3438_c0_g1_i1:221-1759(-)